jgi:hypothetical protein
MTVQENQGLTSLMKIDEKNHQQNISKLNQAMYKKNYTTKPSQNYFKDTKLFQHLKII